MYTIFLMFFFIAISTQFFSIMKNFNTLEHYIDSGKKFNWKQSKIVPDFIESKFERVVLIRNRFYAFYKDSGSNIDEEFEINDTVSLIKYMPRAIEIAILAPFPNFWFMETDRGDSRIRRLVSAMEMSIIYLIFLFMPFTLYYWHSKIELWILLFFCLSISTIYAISVPNIGALYRMRYASELTLAVLGFAGILELVKRIVRNRL